MTWFIVAIVYYAGEVDPKINVMNQSFASKETCQQYYQTMPGVAASIQKLHPEQKQFSLVCMNDQQIQQLAPDKTI